MQKIQAMARKILFINQEISPYVPESEISLMGRELPQAIQEKGGQKDRAKQEKKADKPSFFLKINR